MNRSGPIALLLTAALSACSGGGDTSSPPAQDTSVLVTIEAPLRGAVPRWLTVYGTATPAQNGAVTLSVNEPGQVTRINAIAGSSVRPGEPVVTFAVAPSARSAYEQGVTALGAAQKQRATTAQLLTQQLATRDQLVQADKAVADARTTLAALGKEGAGSAVQTLTAPFSGVVTAVPVAQGDRTQPGAALATVARSGAIVVTVGVGADHAGEVRPGQLARIHPLDGGAVISGRVVRVDRLVNPQTRMVDVDVAYPGGALLSGAAAQVDLGVGTTAGWIVPHRAVVTAESSSRVFQVVNGKARAVPVTVGSTAADADVVAGRLDPNAPVIVDGAYQVVDGSRVRQAKRR